MPTLIPFAGVRYAANIPPAQGISPPYDAITLGFIGVFGWLLPLLAG